MGLLRLHCRRYISGGRRHARLDVFSHVECRTENLRISQVRGVSNGEIQVGWVNHYYLHKLKAANPELSAELLVH